MLLSNRSLPASTLKPLSSLFLILCLAKAAKEVEKKDPMARPSFRKELRVINFVLRFENSQFLWLGGIVLNDAQRWGLAQADKSKRPSGRAILSYNFMIARPTRRGLRQTRCCVQSHLLFIFFV